MLIRILRLLTGLDNLSGHWALGTKNASETSVNAFESSTENYNFHPPDTLP